jgi:hypothetical protein
MKETSEERMALRGALLITLFEILGILFLVSINL